MSQKRLLKIWQEYSVSILFLFLAVAGFLVSGLSARAIAGDLIERLGRNLFLVLALVVPIIAGLGINFSIVIGAMAGQLSLIIITIFSLKGAFGLMAAMLFSLPMGIILGWGIGLLLNRTKGNEMVTSLLLGYFASGVYQMICSGLPLKNTAVALEGGLGIKSTISLKAVQYGFDRFPVDFRLAGFKIPLLPILLSVLLCFFLHYLNKTKLGSDMKAVAFHSEAAEACGIAANKIRIIAIIISTVLSAWGQIISLQNIGTLSTYGSHEQVSIYGAAALLVGGATAKRASAKNAVVGVILFYSLFIVAPKAGNNLFGDAQTGEFFRVFIAYGVIALAMVMNHKKDRLY